MHSREGEGKVARALALLQLIRGLIVELCLFSLWCAKRSSWDGGSASPSELSPVSLCLTGVCHIHKFI